MRSDARICRRSRDAGLHVSFRSHNPKDDRGPSQVQPRMYRGSWPKNIYKIGLLKMIVEAQSRFLSIERSHSYLQVHHLSLVKSPDSASTAPKSLTILVVEDHQDYRLLLSLAIKEAGHTAVLVEDGVLGLDYLAHHACPDLILCDLRMPNMDGDEFIGALRSRDTWNAIPVVLISAEPQAEDIAARYHVGFLQKSRFSPLRDLPAQLLKHCAH